MNKYIRGIVMALMVMPLTVYGFSPNESDENLSQTDFYYYQGKKIPLILNSNKVCVNISKDRNKEREKFLSKVSVLDEINDDFYDIYVISKSDYDKIASTDFKNEYSTQAIITQCYNLENGVEVFTSPYIIIKLKDEKDKDLLATYADEYGFNIISKSPLMPLWYIISITPDCKMSTLECANRLWESDSFASSEPDFCSKNLLCSNDPLFSQQWGLYNSNYQDIDISVSGAWNFSTGKNVKIAIFDEGVDTTHIDLASNIGNLSYDTDSYSSPSVLHGGHGTHCAGIAAAIKDNGIQIAGVAPDATIVPISNSFNFSTLNPYKLANGISWAYQNGVDIISNSWIIYTPCDALTNAINDAFKYGRKGKGCIIVFSSGNDYSTTGVEYPANCNDTILAVGAINNTGIRYMASNYGAGLDLVAPGVNIISTIPYDNVGYNTGTSMACPHVAGVAALILERNSELTVNQVNSIINSSAKKLSGVNFSVTKPDGLWNDEYGYGLVDAYSAVLNTPDTVYIQNDTLTGTRLISAEHIYVGRDVTTQTEQGDVILGPGNITLKAGDIHIKNSTTVPLGTTLKLGE